MDVEVLEYAQTRCVVCDVCLVILKSTNERQSGPEQIRQPAGRYMVLAYDKPAMNAQGTQNSAVLANKLSDFISVFQARMAIGRPQGSSHRRIEHYELRT